MILSSNIESQINKLGTNWQSIVQEIAATISADFGRKISNMIYFQVHLGEWSYASVAEFSQSLWKLATEPDFTPCVTKLLEELKKVEVSSLTEPKEEMVNAHKVIFSAFSVCAEALISQVID
jgi:hypothetical protein